MERYTMIKDVGEGTFGSVWQAVNRETGEIVAIKKMKKKYGSWEECINLREVKSLLKMNHHPNIVKLKEVIKEKNILHMVFEYMECNLYQLMIGRKQLFSEAQVRNWCFQVFQGLAYMHKSGFFHRDLKPENLLVSRDGKLLKIADLGLAREIISTSGGAPYTDYVSTRWYRAPEVLLQSPLYGAPVDMWAMGAIMAELFTLQPLFPGSNEADEMYKICSVIGTPSKETWAEGLALAGSINYQFPLFTGAHLSTILKPSSASQEAIDLITSLCSWDPRKRPTALEALHHPFFQSYFYVPPSLSARPPPPPLAAAAASTTTLPPVVGITGSRASLEHKTTSNSQPLPRYRPPPLRNNNLGSIYPNEHGVVADTIAKFANMTVGLGRQNVRQVVEAPIMKAGGWYGAQSNFYKFGWSQEIQPGRSYTRNVVG